MKIPLVLLLAGSLLGCGTNDDSTEQSSVSAPANASDTETRDEEPQDPTLAAIEALGGEPTFDDESPGKPVTAVVFLGTKIPNDGLVHLKGLTNLQSLNLTGVRVADAELVHLKNLTNLQTLILAGADVSDAGLVHLKGLTNLRELHLWLTGVTAAELVHLEELESLEELSLILNKSPGSELERVARHTSAMVEG